MNWFVPLAVIATLTTLLPGGVALRAAKADVSLPDKKLTPTEMHEDFDLLRGALREAHPGLYRYSTKAAIDRGFETERDKLSRPMSRMEFQAVIAETLALIRCGHTSLNPDPDFEAAERNALTFPLRVMMEGPRLMVVLNDTPADATIRPGMEVLEINGRKVTDILARFRQVLPADGDIDTGKRHDISGRFAKFYWWLVEQPNEFKIKARDEAGHGVVRTLKGVTEAQRKDNHNPVNAAMTAGVDKVMGWAHENLSVRFLADPDIAEIRLKYFIGNDYPKSVEDTFRMLRERGTRTLILDLRGNGGGEDEYGAMLVSYLTDRPFRYFDHINVNTFTPSCDKYLDLHLDGERLVCFREGVTPNPTGGYVLTQKLNTGLAEQKPGKYRFLGKVFVLTDGGSFSCSADFCAITHHLHCATFIGEETGGGYYGNNSGMMPTLTLPRSKLGIRLPMYAYWNAVSGYPGQRRGTIPDYAVELKVSDVMRGVDTQLEAALRVARETAASDKR